jgi:predicted small lipoprotein YifL
MKNKFLNNVSIILLLLLTMSIAACKKDGFLNVPPKGSLTDASTFSSESNADLIVNDVYNQLPDINGESQVLDQYTDNDFVGATWMTGQTTVRSNGINPTNVPGGPAGSFDWASQYAHIRKCNLFLQQAEKNKSNFSADWYKQRIAEVTFLRAFFYSILYTNYGGVPIIKTPLNNSDGTDVFIERSTAEETLAFIEADCDAAAAVLPDKPAQSGRATKGAAITLKGWVELFAASPLSNSSNDAAKWTKAAATNLQVINSKQYTLFPDYNGQFLAANNWNTETIFARGYAAPNKGHRKEGILGPVIVRGGQQAWGNLSPTLWMTMKWIMANRSPILHPVMTRKTRTLTEKSGFINPSFMTAQPGRATSGNPAQEATIRLIWDLQVIYPIRVIMAKKRWMSRSMARPAWEFLPVPQIIFSIVTQRYC